MLKRNFRLMEALGMLFVLVAWGLNWTSVERWSAAQTSHERVVEEIMQTYHHVQITANVVLESAISRASVASTAPNATSDLPPYQRAWHSADVRRAWLQRASNGGMQLDLLISALHDTDEQYRLLLGTRIVRLREDFSPIEQRLQSFSAQKGWIPVPSFDEDALSAKGAGDMDRNVGKLAEQAFIVHEEVLNAIAARRKLSTRIYNTVFFIGTFLIIVSKILEWQIGRRPVEENRKTLGNFSSKASGTSSRN
jgi:hypothetical protein